MPELPEVESVRRLMERTLVGREIKSVEVMEDSIVLGKHAPSEFVTVLQGAKIESVGRHGKFWWLQIAGGPCVFGHLGMSGWIRQVGGDSIRLHSHGKAALDDEEGRPRFLKLLLETTNGNRIAFTDGRRLGRLWIGESPETDPQVKKLGPDVFTNLPSSEALVKLLAKRTAPIKALLLDQSKFAGVGNWIADEVLYQARIAPSRVANTLSNDEVSALREAIRQVVTLAVEVDADYERYPEDWLFKHRWGGNRGVEWINGHKIVRETVAGRTTAWVPEVQS